MTSPDQNNKKPQDDASQPENSADETTAFNINTYIPFPIVRTQLWMHRAINYENYPKIKAIAPVSKTEVRVIMLIHAQLGITPSQIADYMGFDRAIVTRAINTLLKKELIHTKTSSRDQRSKALYLSDKGEKLCNELINIFRKFSNHLEAVLEPTEKETLMSILEKLMNASQSYNGED